MSQQIGNAQNNHFSHFRVSHFISLISNDNGASMSDKFREVFGEETLRDREIKSLLSEFALIISNINEIRRESIKIKFIPLEIA